MSEVEIANLAIGRVQSTGRISSLDEAAPEASLCKLHLPSVRDAILRAVPWNCANAFENLALINSAPTTLTATTAWGSNTPGPGWLYTYAIPDNCLAVRKVIPQDNGAYSNLYPSAGSTPAMSRKARGAKYERCVALNSLGNEVAAIWTNAGGAGMYYTRKITNTNLWDANLVQAIVAALAAQICLPLTGDKTMQRILADEARSLVLAAQSTDASETFEIMEVIPDELQVRGFQGMNGGDEYFDSVGPFGKGY